MTHISRRRLQALRLVRVLLLLLAILGTAGDKALAEVAGKGAHVITADSFELAGQIIRLYGIRGPDPGALCPIGDGTWPCGREARWAAGNRLGRHWVVCVERSQGSGAGVLAVCYLGGIGGPELNSWLVEKGWAVSDPSVPQNYGANEEAARAAGLGLWRGGFDATLLFP